MKPTSILTLPDPLLRQVLAPVQQFKADLSRLADEMRQIMRQADGVGLAANQVGINLQLFVYQIVEPFTIEGEKVAATPFAVVVNPKITILDHKTKTLDEGCLSVPGLHGPVARPIKIRLTAQNVDGTPWHRDISDYEARVVQHEVDHLNGILFLDRLTDPTKLYHQDDGRET